MAGSRSVEDVVDVVVPRLQDAVAVEVRNLAQVLATRADEVRAKAVAERDASLARERKQALDERAAAIAAAAAAAREQVALDVVSRLLDAVRRLDDETTLRGVLDALADLAAAEAGRAAVFVAADGGLRVWRLVGFEAAADEAGRVLAAGDAGVAGRAIDERRSVRVTRGVEAGAQDRPPAFATLPADRTGVAVPVLIGGEPLVAIYADEGTERGLSDSARWIPAIELIARHARSRLEALSAERAAAFARDAVSPAPEADTDSDAAGADARRRRFSGGSRG